MTAVGAAFTMELAVSVIKTAAVVVVIVGLAVASGVGRVIACATTMVNAVPTVAVGVAAAAVANRPTAATVATVVTATTSATKPPAVAVSVRFSAAAFAMDIDAAVAMVISVGSVVMGVQKSAGLVTVRVGLLVSIAAAVGFDPLMKTRSKSGLSFGLAASTVAKVAGKGQIAGLDVTARQGCSEGSGLSALVV